MGAPQVSGCVGECSPARPFLWPCLRQNLRRHSRLFRVSWITERPRPVPSPVRRWLAAEGYKGDGPIPTIPDEVRVEASRRYIQACDEIRGTAFAPDESDPLPRIAKNLGLEAP